MKEANETNERNDNNTYIYYYNYIYVNSKIFEISSSWKIFYSKQTCLKEIINSKRIIKNKNVNT